MGARLSFCLRETTHKVILRLGTGCKSAGQCMDDHRQGTSRNDLKNEEVKVGAPKSELNAPMLSVVGLSGTSAKAAAVSSRPLFMDAPARQFSFVLGNIHTESPLACLF